MPRVKKELASTSKNCGNVVRGLRRSGKAEVDSSSSANHHNEQLQQPKQKQKQPQSRREVEEEEEDNEDELVLRRQLRSRYLEVKNSLTGAANGLLTPDSDRFKAIIEEVESLHKKVQKPREQVADAEALLDITSSFVKSVKAHKNEGLTPSDFVSSLIRGFGQQVRGTSNEDDSRNLILWKDIGLAVSHIFRKGTGCCTMLGPMSSELKKRKTIVRKKHVKPTETSRPEELDNTKEEKTDTDKNMSTMFGILKKNRSVRLENLIINRNSFAQTVENLFALSFLVKDGRAEITAKENGHFVCPRNAPAAESVASGKVSYSHFVFRFDFKDWKLMLDSVGEGEELMPHRVQAGTSSQPEIPVEPENVNPETTATTTPIRKLSRNRGLVLQEQNFVEESPEAAECDDRRSRGMYIRRGKRKII